MTEPAVLEELLAVVRREDDDRLLIEPVGRQPVEQATDAGIGVADLFVVEVA